MEHIVSSDISWKQCLLVDFFLKRHRCVCVYVCVWKGLWALIVCISLKSRISVEVSMHTPIRLLVYMYLPAQEAGSTVRGGSMNQRCYQPSIEVRAALRKVNQSRRNRHINYASSLSPHFLITCPVLDILRLRDLPPFRHSGDTIFHILV